MEDNQVYFLPGYGNAFGVVQQLRSVFQDQYSDNQLLQAFAQFNYSIDETVVYLQDIQSTLIVNVENEPITRFIPAIFKVQFESEQISFDSSANLIVEPPTRSKIALEFSLSPHYQPSEKRVFYINDDIIRHIFSFLCPASRAKNGRVCKSWRYIDLTSSKLYQKDCIDIWGYTIQRPSHNVFPFPYSQSDLLWGEDYPYNYQPTVQQTQVFKGWRDMYIRRPRVRFNGVYVAKTRYLKPGETNLTYVQPVHVVIFYRYFKFYPDFSVLCLTTTDKIDKVANKFKLDNPMVTKGEWAIKGKQVFVHLLQTRTIFSYELDVASSYSGAHNGLKLKSYYYREIDSPQVIHMNSESSSIPKVFLFFEIKNANESQIKELVNLL